MHSLSYQSSLLLPCSQETVQMSCPHTGATLLVTHMHSCAIVTACVHSYLTGVLQECRNEREEEIGKRGDETQRGDKHGRDGASERGDGATERISSKSGEDVLPSHAGYRHVALLAATRQNTSRPLRPPRCTPHVYKHTPIHNKGQSS